MLLLYINFVILMLFYRLWFRINLIVSYPCRDFELQYKLVSCVSPEIVSYILS